MAWAILKKFGLADYATLAEFVDAERTRYVSGFVIARDALSKQVSAPAPELLISINTDTIRYPYRYLRVDLMRKDRDGTPRAIALQDDEPRKGKTLTFKLGELVVEAHPFVWCDTKVRFNAPVADLTALERWMTEKLDVEDTNPRGPQKESLAVHSFSPIEPAGTWWTLRADLGTAPSATLIELVQILGSQGATQVAIS